MKSKKYNKLVYITKEEVDSQIERTNLWLVRWGEGRGKGQYMTRGLRGTNWSSRRGAVVNESD